MTNFSAVVRACLALLALAFSANSLADEASSLLVITDADRDYELGRHVALYENAGRDLTIHQVASPDFAARFIASEVRIPNPKETDGVVWVRLQLHNDSSEVGHWKLVVGDARLALAELYLPQPGSAEGYAVQRAGNEVPFHERAVEHRLPVFDLSLEPGQSQTLYLRAESNGGFFALPLRIRTQGSWGTYTQGEYAFLGLFFGTLLMVLAYNLVLFVSLKDSSFLYLSLYIVGMGLWSGARDGLVSQFLFTNGPVTYPAIVLGSSVGLAGLALFSISFLETGRHGGITHWSLKLLAMFYAGTAILGLFGVKVLVLINTVASLLIFVSLLAGLASLRRGERAAYWYLIALATFFLSGLTIVAANSGLAPEYPGLSIGSYPGIAAVALLFSLGLADRFRLLQLRAVAVSKENELLVRDQKKHLEHEVAARTNELTHANTALTEARERAETANRSKDEFLANVSHEMRTPMNAVLGFADLLAQTPQSDEQRRWLHHIRSASAMLQRLINDLLDLSRIEVGALELHPAYIDPRMLVRDLEDGIRIRANAKGLDFRVILDPAMPDGLLMDAVRVRQILSNLIGNALNYTDNGEIELSLGAEQDGEDTFLLTATVRDTGVGIPGGSQADIFKPFVRLHRSKHETGGVGLGLTISQQLARQMDGRLELKSRVGEGSTFRLILPCLHHSASADTDQSETVVIPRFRGARILVADDESWNRDLLCAYLTDSDVIVDTAENGALALEKVREQRPDLILLDIGMPVMDGIEAMRALRQSDARSVPVIAVTAAAIGSRAREAANLADTVVTKPVSRARLLKEIARYIEHEPGVKWQTGYKADQAPPRPAPAPSALDATQICSTRESQLSALLVIAQGFNSALASRLHDYPVPELGKIRAKMNTLGQDQPGSGSVHGESHDEVTERIGQVIKWLRSLMFDLGLHRLLVDGLSETLAAMADYLHISLDIPVNYIDEGDIELPQVCQHVMLHALVLRLREIWDTYEMDAVEFRAGPKEGKAGISLVVRLRAPSDGSVDISLPPATWDRHLPALGISFDENIEPGSYTLIASCKPDLH